MNKHEIIKANYGRAINKMRQKIHFQVRTLGWLKTDNRGPLTPAEWAKAGAIASDWFLNNEHSPVRKSIDIMTHKELRMAVTVLDRLIANHYKKVSQPQ